MEFKDGYPKPNGASDYDDSSHLAGILAITDHPQAPDMRKYCFPVTTIVKNGIMIKDFIEPRYMRNPWTDVDCSRDQAILIMCGLLKQGHKDLVRTDFINGKDILLPSVHGIETIAKTGKPTWLQRKCFEAELRFDGESIEEPFQNFAKAWAYGSLKLWTEINPKWDVAIYNYMAGGRNRWRDERDLAIYCIDWIRRR